jgi:hypothetical protein
MTDFFARNEALLKRAIEAIGARAYFSAYPESASPKIYGETAKADDDDAFDALLSKRSDCAGSSDERVKER